MGIYLSVTDNTKDLNPTWELIVQVFFVFFPTSDCMHKIHLFLHVIKKQQIQRKASLIFTGYFYILFFYSDFHYLHMILYFKRV